MRGNAFVRKELDVAGEKVLAVASGGGHWIELMRVMPAFDGYSTTYVTVRSDYSGKVPDSPFHVVNDATSWSLVGLALQAVRMFLIVVFVRPHIVVTTGAAPGYFAVRFGKWFGARTIWLDSLANVEQLSKAGRMAGPYSDLWLTQWPSLAKDGGPRYAGRVI